MCTGIWANLFQKLENDLFFFSLKDKYLSDNQNEPMTIVSIQVDDKFKQTEFSKYSRAPHSLNNLISQIQMITKTRVLIE